MHLIIRPHLSIEEVEEAIQQEMSRINQPLIGASVQIDLKCPTLKEEDAAYLKSKLQETYNLTVRGIEALDEQATSTYRRRANDACTSAQKRTRRTAVIANHQGLYPTPSARDRQKISHKEVSLSMAMSIRVGK